MKHGFTASSSRNPDIHLYSNQDTTLANAARTKLANDHIRPICKQILQARKACVSLRQIARFLDETDRPTRRDKAYTAISVSRMIERYKKMIVYSC